MGFLKIAITPPEFFENEHLYIETIVKNGFDYVHIRKPDAAEDDVERLITNIDPAFHEYLKLHGQFGLLKKFNLGGVHINSRCPEAPATTGSVSCSCHSIEECINGFKAGFHYTTLSPIYDSISKPGYHSNFIISEISNHIRNKNVIALGGITPLHIPELKQNGFSGMAMLGYLFSADSISDLECRLKDI